MTRPKPHLTPNHAEGGWLCYSHLELAPSGAILCPSAQWTGDTPEEAYAGWEAELETRLGYVFSDGPLLVVNN